MDVLSQPDNKFMFPQDHSEWAKSFLNGRQAVTEIAGSVKLLSNADSGPLIIDLDTSTEEVPSHDSLEDFFSRKGK